MKDEFSSILTSPRVLELLEMLDGEVERGALSKTMGLTKSHLAQLLKRCEELAIITRKEDKIYLTAKVKAVKKFLSVIEGYGKFLEVFGKYMNVYSLDDIPYWLVARLYELRDIKVVERKEDFLSPHKEFIEGIANSEEIYGYATVLFDEYIDFFLRMAEEGRKIEIIVSKEILDRILKDFGKELVRGLEKENVGFYVSRRNFRLSFIVADDFFSISFYFAGGAFDYKRDFVCRSEDARRWGLDLFSHIKKFSDRVSKEGLKELIRGQ